MNQLDVASQKIARACDGTEMRGLCGGCWIKGSCYVWPGLPVWSRFIIRSRASWGLTRRRDAAPNEGLWMRPRGSSISWAG